VVRTQHNPRNTQPPRFACLTPALFCTLLLAAPGSAGAQAVTEAPTQTAQASSAAVVDTTTDSAATQPQLQTQARALLADNQPAQARALLQALYASGEIDNQSLFLLALAAKQQADWPAAKTYLNELLARDPAAGGRVKLELAEALFRNNEPIRARQLLQEVKASNPPPRVGENIDAFLAFIKSGTPSLFSGWASLGRLYDSNANQGPNLDTVLIYNLPFTLDKDARGNADWATVLRGGVNFNHAVNDRLAVQAGVSVYSTDYDTLDRFDVVSLSANVGPSFKRNGWSFSLPYVFNTVKIGHEADWYQRSHGVAPQFGWQINPRVSLQGSLAWQDKRYRGSRARGGKALTFSPSLRVGINASSYASAGGYVGREGSGIQTSRNSSHGLNLGYYKAFNQNWNLYVSPSWSQTDYKGMEAAYNTGRKDERWDVTGNLNYRIAPWGANLTLSYTYTHNRSSIAMYQYKREQTMLSIAKDF